MRPCSTRSESADHGWAYRLVSLVTERSEPQPIADAYFPTSASGRRSWTVQHPDSGTSTATPATVRTEPAWTMSRSDPAPPGCPGTVDGRFHGSVRNFGLNSPLAGKDLHNLSTSGERIVDRAAAAPASDRGRETCTPIPQATRRSGRQPPGGQAVAGRTQHRELQHRAHRSC